MGKLFSNPFLKKIKIEHISGSIAESYTQFAIIVQQVEGYLKIQKLSCRPLAFTSCKAFLKQKEPWKEKAKLEKYFSCYLLIIGHILLSIAWLFLLLEILVNICIVIVCQSGCGVINFEINLIFLIKPFLLHKQKFKTKI